jgi:class 3 adenylate cyclase
LNERVEDLRLVRLAGQRRRAVQLRPRDRRHAGEAEADVVAEAGGSDADNRESPALPLHRFQVNDGAKFVELPGDDQVPHMYPDQILDEIEEFLTGTKPAPGSERVLATVLFTDVVGSTEQARELGDHRWAELLERHHEAVRRELARYGCEEIDTAGDGFLALGEGPTSTIRCALSIRDSVGSLGLSVRAGVHTGEVERPRGGSPRGIAVHVGARVAGAAGPNEVFVSSTTGDLVAGSGIELEDRGEFELKGVGKRRLYAATV